MVRTGSIFDFRAASRALAICSRSALEELAAFEGGSDGCATSAFRAALAFAICSRRAVDELDAFRLVGGAFRLGDGATGLVIAVPGGDVACPKGLADEELALGVSAIMLLRVDRGRGFGVFWRFCAGESGCFLVGGTRRETEGVLLGVVADTGVAALTLRLPGAVMASLPGRGPNLWGVVGGAWDGPSLDVGLLLLDDMAEVDRNGGGKPLSAPKKLDLRLPFLPAGDEGRCERLWMVRSESEGRGVSLESSPALSDTNSLSLSLHPALDPALEDAREAERKSSRLPSASSSVASSVVVFGLDADRGVGFVWLDGGRARGFLKTEASCVGARVGPALGMPLTRRVEGGAREARLVVVVVVVVDGPLVGASDTLEAFFCRVNGLCGDGVGAGAGAGGWTARPGRDRDEMDVFLRSCSVEAGDRSWEWLAEARNTGRRDDGGGLGMADTRGVALAG